MLEGTFHYVKSVVTPGESLQDYSSPKRQGKFFQGTPLLFLCLVDAVYFRNGIIPNSVHRVAMYLVVRHSVPTGQETL